jgi:hypothetical protein
VPQIELIGNLLLFTDLRKNATPTLSNKCHARHAVVDGPCRGSARYFLGIALLPKEEKY